MISRMRRLLQRLHARGGGLAGLLLLSLLSSGCVTSVSRPSAVATYARYDVVGTATRLGAYVASERKASGVEPAAEMAGFRLISDGPEALAARLALIDAAEQSLDLQYYIFNGDVSGSIVAERLLAAADRGVRVRLLLDDIGARMGDSRVIRLGAHPNIELRLFNPLTVRARWLALPSQISEFGRINYRMHNKLMVADNQIVITGGRNIGDEYFSIEALDFQDIDTIAIGGISLLASVSFDDYWNSYLAVPIQDISPRKVEPRDLGQLRARLERQRRQDPRWAELMAMADSTGFAAMLHEERLHWFWGGYAWMSDPAAKADPSSALSGTPIIGRELISPLPDLEEELLIISPYFIPQDVGMGLISDLRARGIRVAVLSNSLATTDVIAVHANYKRYRVPLLEAGVELSELRGGASLRELPNAFAGSSMASLHAKSYIYDRRMLYVGSINLDPRSMNLNTEAGVLIRQPELARHAVELFEQWTTLDNAFRLELGEGDRVAWRGPGRVFHREPEASLGRRLINWFVGLLPIESQM